MRRSFYAVLMVVSAATTVLAQSDGYLGGTTRLTYVKPAAAAVPTVFTYYQPAAAPTVEPQPPCCAPCAPQVVQPVPAPPPYFSYRPIVPLAPMPETYYAGQGILGQPKLYVPGQPVRNLLRYLGP